MLILEEVKSYFIFDTVRSIYFTICQRLNCAATTLSLAQEQAEPLRNISICHCYQIYSFRLVKWLTQVRYSVLLFVKRNFKLTFYISINKL